MGKNWRRNRKNEGLWGLVSEDISIYDFHTRLASSMDFMKKPLIILSLSLMLIGCDNSRKDCHPKMIELAGKSEDGKFMFVRGFLCDHE